MASRRRATAIRPSRRVTASAILDSIGALVYAADLKGRLIYVNARGARLLGYDVADIKRFVGAPFFDFLAPHMKSLAAETMAQGARRALDIHTFRIDVRRKDGRPVTLEIQATPLWRRDVVVGRVGLARIVDPARDTANPSAIENAVLAERERLSEALRDSIAEVLRTTFADDEHAKAGGVTEHRSVELMRRHGMDDTDLAIVRLITQGASNPEIGRQVNLSVDAVKDRIGRLMRRFGARRRAELSAQAMRAGIK